MNMEESFSVRTSRACAYLLEKYKWMANSPASAIRTTVRQSWVTDDEIEKIVECNTKGMTVMQIANAVGRSHSTVIKVMREKGLEKNKMRRVSPAEMEVMWKMKRDGSTVIDIIRLTGYSEKTIHNYIKKYESQLNERHA